MGTPEYQYSLEFGEQLLFSRDVETYGMAAIINKSGIIDIRVGLFPKERLRHLYICSNNVFTVWEVSTGAGILQSLSVYPLGKLPARGLPRMTISFESAEPFLRVQQELEAPWDPVDIADSLWYDGAITTGVLMKYGKTGRFAPRVIDSNEQVRLERVDGKDRIVIHSGTHIEWVTIKETLSANGIVSLLANSREDDIAWREQLADLMHKFRHQVIKSDF